jgi:YbbR domain-containing protein
MSLLRGLLLENLGLKIVALLMAVLVYLNVYLDRPATLLVSFPIQVTGLGDSLSLVGPLPGAVQAELRGTGKQLVRLRLGEPLLEVSLAGVQAGRFERTLSAADLPLADHPEVAVERLVGPLSLQLTLDRRVARSLPVAPRVEGVPASGPRAPVVARVEPLRVTVTGPESAIAGLDSLVLDVVRIEGRRDTVRVQVAPAALPEWCSADPPVVTVTVPLREPR